jgi:proteasome lid subunit RPN8/RPN11
VVVSLRLFRPKVVAAPAVAPAEAPVMRVTWRVLSRIRATIGKIPHESGGPLGMSASGEITAFVLDSSAATGPAAYSPDTTRLNRLFRKRWNPRGVRLAGFVHSHPPGFLQPSEGDRLYAVKLFAALPHLDAFYLPIVRSNADREGFEFRPFVALRDPAGGARLSACRLIILG